MKNRKVDQEKQNECISYLIKEHIGFYYKGYTLVLIDCYSDTLLKHLVNTYTVYYDGTELIIDFEIYNH